MAMTVASLKARIKSALGTAEDDDKQSAFAEAIATAIIAELTENMVVTIPANAIHTAGSASAQQGPTSTLALSGAVS